MRGRNQGGLSVVLARSSSRAARSSAVFVTYNGLLDPLGHSQMLPYLERLNVDWPIRILSFERKDKLAATDRVRAMEQRLAEQDIGWVRMRYHQKPSLPATTYDMLSGVVALRRLMRRERVGLVHARGYLPMEMGANAVLGTRTPLLFDIRGLQAEEYVDGGVWREGELKWRLAKRSERRFFRKASGAVVLTEAIRPYVAGRFAETHSSASAPPIAVIPCCVDLDRFDFDAGARARIRAELGVADDTVVFVYSGSLGTWYLSDAMAQLVRTFAATTGRKAFLLWIANNDQALARAASERAGLAPTDYRITSAPAEKMTEWLCAGDVGLALIKPCFSKKSSSPTKYAEYLAVGMPIVISRDVGDGALIEQDGGAVALGERIDAHALEEAAAALANMVGAPRNRFRDVAKKHFDVDRVALPTYRELYRTLMGP